MNPKDELELNLKECLAEISFLCADMNEVLNFDDFDVHEGTEQIKAAKAFTNKTYAILKEMEALSNELKLYGS